MYFIYDIETYPNCFTMALLCPDGSRVMFEISEYVDNTADLIAWLNYINQIDAYMVGFNNEAFDYYVIHGLIQNPSIGYRGLYDRAQQIINNREKWPPKIFPDQRHCKQLDLYKINHFDNKARRTSLKVIEFNLRMNSIQDLPYQPGKVLNYDQIQNLKIYNWHDVDATKDFFDKCKASVDFRIDLIPEMGPNVINYNDTKIGKQFFINELEKHDPSACFHKVNGKKEPKQTPREIINVDEIIFDYVKFNSVEFDFILNHLRAQKLTNTLKVPEITISAHFAGLLFNFGGGGMHASVEGAQILADEENLIIDLDVTSYYPSLAIENNLFPEHLSENFVKIYADLKEQRTSHAKGTAKNKALKLALNGVYGDSNNVYSPFYDPKYTMSITINGQLLLCMLAEELDKIPDLKIIQVNTDGVTVKIPKRFEKNLISVWQNWEKLTGLTLERADYSKMFIRDVNNYFAVTTDSILKRKGAYCHISPMHDESNYELDWHKDHGGLIIPKAAEAFLLHGEPVEKYLRDCYPSQLLDFCFRAKVLKSSRLELRTGENVEILQNTSRYIVTNNGGSLIKVMPPLAKNPTKERDIGINASEKVTILNNISSLDAQDINFTYYVSEANKLIKGVSNCLL